MTNEAVETTPGTPPFAGVLLGLQRSYGNQAVRTLLTSGVNIQRRVAIRTDAGAPYQAAISEDLLATLKANVRSTSSKRAWQS